MLAAPLAEPLLLPVELPVALLPLVLLDELAECEGVPLALPIVDSGSSGSPAKMSLRVMTNSSTSEAVL